MKQLIYINNFPNIIKGFPKPTYQYVKLITEYKQAKTFDSDENLINSNTKQCVKTRISDLSLSSSSSFSESELR